MTAFVPRLRRRLGDEAVDRILVANPARLYAMPVGACAPRAPRERTATTSSSSAPGRRARSAAITRGAARRAHAARRPARVHGRHVDGGARHVLCVLHPGRPARGASSAASAGRSSEPADRGRRRLRAAEHLRRGDRRHLRRRRRSRSSGSASPRTRASSCCSTPGRRASAWTTTAASTRSGCGTRAASAGWRRRAFVDASGDADVCAMAGVPHDDPGDAGRRPVAVDPVQARQRGHRAGGGRAQGRAVGADARGRRAAAATGCRGSRARGTGRRTTGVALIHMTRIPNVDATDPAQLTGRRGRGPPPGAGVPPLPARPGARLRAVRRRRRRQPGDRGPREPAGARRLPADARRRARRPPVRRRDRAVRRADRGPRRRRRHGVAVRGRVGRVRHPVPTPPAGGDRGAAGGRPLLLRDARRARVGALDGDLHGDGPGRRDGRRAGRRRRHDPARRAGRHPP